jgi:hypothetical protein
MHGTGGGPVIASTQRRLQGADMTTALILFGGIVVLAVIIYFIVAPRKS